MTSISPIADAGATPSPSARYVALVRALLDRPRMQSGDPVAEMRLYASLLWDDEPFGRFMAARTQFVDTCLLRALSTGISQVVTLGAGYDGRALRFRSPGVTFFELDLPATQADKRRRLDRLGQRTADLVFAPADLATEPVADVLHRTTHDPALPTVFICEGVLLYLPSNTIGSFLASAYACSAPGSVLVCTFAIGGPRAPRAHGRTASEVRQSFFTPAAARDIVRASGWESNLVTTPNPAISAAEDVALFVQAVRT